MSNLTDDNIKALASGSAKRGSGINLGYLGGDDPNDDDDEYTPLDISSSSEDEESSADPDRCHELRQQTSQLISDYHDFLSEMDMNVEELCTASNNEDGIGRPQPSSSRDEENISATREGVMHQPYWARGEPEDHHQNLAPMNLETDPEDLPSSGVWPDNPGLGYDYDEDRKKAYRYRFSFCQYNRGWVMISVCAIALLAVLSLTVKKKQPVQQAADDTVSIDPMALTKNEQAALDYMDPLWFGRKDGYQGTTHQEAVDFCNSIGDRQLCIPEAYCPNGSPNDGEINPQPLFLKMNAFPSEQWAAISLNANSWLLVGTIDGNNKTTCQTYDTVHDGAQPLWGFDGSSTELKEHVMCCLRPVEQAVQVKSSQDISSSPENAVQSSSKYSQDISSSPENAVQSSSKHWFTRGDYKGHTYEFAKEYCSTKIQNGHLCAYEDICPGGPGSSPFSPPVMTTEQWAPVAELNTWVLVGQGENGDFSLNCFTHKDLYGREASFGNPGYEEKTENILCCGRS